MAQFKAKVQIQGVGNYVQHGDRDGNETNEGLVVLFPSLETRVGQLMRDIDGKPICRHYVRVEFDARCVKGGGLPDLWTSLDGSKHRIEVRAGGGEAFRIAPQGLGAWHRDELFRVNDAMHRYRALNPAALPGPNLNPDLLAGALFVNGGVLSANGDYQGAVRLYDGDGTPISQDDQQRAGTIQVEHGLVEDLTVVMKPFDGTRVREVPLEPAGDADEVVVWVRHICDLRRPGTVKEMPTPGAPDEDHPANYLLHDGIDEILETFGHRIQHPRFSQMWAGGDPKGSDPVRCAGCWGYIEEYERTI